MALFGSGGNRGISALNLALLGVLAYRTLKGKGRLADMLGRGQSAGPNYNPNPNAIPHTSASSDPLGGLLTGGLGGLLGGAGAGTAISAGLGHLLERLRTNGQGDKAQSWVSRGANADIAPSELEQGLGEERMQWLMQETGMSRQELLAGLSRALPDAVDRLTPDGRLPTEEEMTWQLRQERL